MRHVSSGGNIASLIIEFSEEEKAALAAKARSRGLSPEQYARQVLEHDLVPEWLRKLIRVVLDTNVLVSALLQPLGVPGRVLLLTFGQDLRLCVSGVIYAEYQAVIRLPRLQAH